MDEFLEEEGLDNLTVPAMLKVSAALYAERNKAYGNNYKRFGNIIEGLFPDGITIKTVKDANRLALLFHVIDKLTRYTNAFADGGHDDSLQDMAVYATMLREIDSKS